jgi:hypothetical protein
MKPSTPPLAPLALITLRAHPPAPARVEVEYLPRLQRAVRAVLCLVVFWGAIPALVFVPPHYPWVIGAFAAGAYLAHRYWTGRYVVRSFSGSCPRCGRPLELRTGTRIDLPHALTCFGCHHEPVLETDASAASAGDTITAAAALAHRAAHCVGSWGYDPGALRPFLICRGCGARHPATADAQRVADRENEMGRLLTRLTREGGPLI